MTPAAARKRSMSTMKTARRAVMALELPDG